jgi:CheY-specific phosphatase CheX
MTSCFSEILGEILLRSTQEVFADCGVVLLPTSEPRLEIGDLHVGAHIAFEGPQIRGSLLLISTFHMTAKTRFPKLGGAPLSSRVACDWILIRDWIAELANRLLGRAKNRLLAFGVQFQVATPVPLSGRGLSLASQKQSSGRSLTFGRGEDVVRLVVDVIDEPMFTSRKPQAAVEEPAREGDVIEF